MNSRLHYLLTSTRKRLTGTNLACPSCGSVNSKLVARKYVVTHLRRCTDCGLLYRTPTTSADENSNFYQNNYSEGFTTTLPDDATLSNYLIKSFRGTEKDYAKYLNVLVAAGANKGDRLFDFGCSWGYGSWQFMQAGFDVEAFEISVPRARFATEQLDVRVHTKLPDIRERFDVFFSAHVLEHVPSVADTIAFAMQILKPGGLFVSFTPNGSSAYRSAAPDAWGTAWGSVHPNFLDDLFYAKRFAGNKALITSSPYDDNEIQSWRSRPGNDISVARTDGSELVVLVRK